MKTFFFRYGIQITSVVACITVLSFQYRRDSVLLNELLEVDVPVQDKREKQDESKPKILQFLPVFGTPPAPEKIQQEQTQQLPETRLELKLKGTFTNSQQEKASAIIAAPNGKSRLFFVGDPIVEGTSLARVDKGVVVLSSNGNFEVLRLPRMTPEQNQSDGFFVSKATSKGNVETTDFNDTPTPDYSEVQDLIIASATVPEPVSTRSNPPARTNSNAGNEQREFVSNSGRSPTPSLRSRLEKLRARQKQNRS